MESIFCIKVSLTTQVVSISWLDSDDTQNFLSTYEITFQTFVGFFKISVRLEIIPSPTAGKAKNITAKGEAQECATF